MPADLEPTPVGDDAEMHGRYAGMISRGLAWAIDLTIVSTAGFATFFIINSTLAILGVPTANCPRFVPLYDIDSFQENLCRIARSGEYFITLFLPQVYFVFFWWLGGQTIGKGIVGIKVIRAGGGPMRLSTALFRLLGYFLAIIPLGMGFFWALLDSRRQGWHDKIAGTYVIYWRIPRRRVQTRRAVRRTAAPVYEAVRLPSAPAGAGPNGKDSTQDPHPIQEREADP